MISLRRRLLLILLTSFTFAWCLLGVLTFYNAQEEIEELFDAQLAQSARVLMSLTKHELEEDDKEKITISAPDYNIGHHYEKKIAFQIWQNKLLLLHTSTATTKIISDKDGFSDKEFNGKKWRVFGLSDPKLSARVIVAERYDIRNELIYLIAKETLLPIIIALPILAILIWTGVRRGLAPLRRVARDIKSRTPSQLEPISESTVPDEIKPLARSLNELLRRLEQALQSERRFTADAAHELRTPLAGIKAQAQVALRATSDESRDLSLQQIIRGVDHSTHLVEQLLTLARLDPDSTETDFVAIDGKELITEIIAEFTTQADEKNISLESSIDSDNAIFGQRSALGIMLRNLIDNALRYSSADSKVVVRLTSTGDKSVIYITDTGPGIPEIERTNVMNRFYRLQDSNAKGSGLGLAIARRIVDIHKGDIVLETGPNGKGLQVRITLPNA